jgi:hypothetical protein
VDEELERRIGRNEALFREVNEAIARGLWPGEEQSPVRFRCECARIDCNGTIELNAVTYSGVRAHPRRFMVLVGHQLAEVEDVVERREGYVVVEKRDEAGAVAGALDPPG